MRRKCSADTWRINNISVIDYLLSACCASGRLLPILKGLNVRIMTIRPPAWTP